MENNNLQKSISTDQLCLEYNWYSDAFPKLIQQAFDEFFEHNFETHFIGLSKNINFLVENESCFVTKVMINNDYEIFVRLTEKSLMLILNKCLGTKKNRFNINQMTDLETKVITRFNDYLYHVLKENVLQQIDGAEVHRNNYDTMHLTFIIKDVECTESYVGKIIVAIPQNLIASQTVQNTQDAFCEDDFPNIFTQVRAKMGKMKFPLFDIQNLETDDLVVFENSDLEHMEIEVNGINLPVKLRPNMEILIPDENENSEGEIMDSNRNIWDNIEVEVTAEFDSIKLTLGELKKIETGLVVDLTSLYDNTVTLKVDGNNIASGSLVIVNDRYGVKIDKVLNSNGYPQQETQQIQSNDAYQQEQQVDSYQNDIPLEGSAPVSEDEEFDYSDFEVEDDNI